MRRSNGNGLFLALGLAVSIVLIALAGVGYFEADEGAASAAASVPIVSPPPPPPPPADASADLEAKVVNDGTTCTGGTCSGVNIANATECEAAAGTLGDLWTWDDAELLSTADVSLWAGMNSGCVANGDTVRWNQLSTLDPTAAISCTSEKPCICQCAPDTSSDSDTS